MKTIRILGPAVAVAAVLSLLSMLHAWAQPVPGAAYSGEITGCAQPPCGSVHFTVSGDGSQVLGFTAYNVPGEDSEGEDCEFVSYLFPVPLDIVDDSFGPGIEGMYEVSGSFPSAGNAQGTLRLVVYDPFCDTGVLNWTATTGSPSPMPVGGIAELPDVSGSSAGSCIALAGLAVAALVALAASAWYAKRRWLG